MKYIIAIDQGTTSSRSVLFDMNGNVQAMRRQEFPQIFPRPGWVEHDPIDIWTSQLSTVRQLVHEEEIDAVDIVAIGITNQRETTVVWEKTTGEPIYHAIVWQDRRTASFCEKLQAAGKEDFIRQRTGLLLDAYFSGTKLNWILENVDGAREKADKGELLCGTVDTWLLYKLTGGRVHATDYTNASRTLLFDIHRCCWDSDMLDLLNIPASMLPEVRPSIGNFGTLDSGIIGFPVPVTGIAGDQQAALFGQRCWQRGMAKNTYGTGCFMLMNTGERAVTSEKGLLTTIAWGDGDKIQYALEGSVFVAGAVVQWLRDQLGVIQDASETEDLAFSVPDNGGVYFVPAFTGLGTPHWDMYARGALFGLTRGSNKAHLARAALESIVFQCGDVLKAMEVESGIPLVNLRVDGGATANNFLMQFQADMLGVPVFRGENLEATALGIAYMAGLGSGVWTQETIQNFSVSTDTYVPQMDVKSRAFLEAGWQKAVSRAKGWEEKE